MSSHIVSTRKVREAETETLVENNDARAKDRTSPGGRSVFNDAMSPRPSLPTTGKNTNLEDKLDMNSILRKKITSPTHMRRFDSADYFMEREFPQARERPDSDDIADVPAAALLMADEDHRRAIQMQRAKNPPAPAARHETRWASRTTRPAELALNSPHPAGPRAMRQESLADVFNQQQEKDLNEAWANVGNHTPPGFADMKAVLRAKVAGKSRLQRFDSADYFLNQSTGLLEQRVAPPAYRLRHRSFDDTSRKSSSGMKVSPIKSLAIATNIGSRSRQNSASSAQDYNFKTRATGLSELDHQNSIPSDSIKNDDVEAGLSASAQTSSKNLASSGADSYRLRRSQPRSLQPGRQQRSEVRARLGERAELAARVPASPSDNLNVFFRKKYAPKNMRDHLLRQQQLSTGANKASARTLTPTSGPSNSTHTTPQTSGPSRRRSLSRPLPGAESLRTHTDIRKAALQSRLQSQGKAL